MFEDIAYRIGELCVDKKNYAFQLVDILTSYGYMQFKTKQLENIVELTAT